jgi:hypothetical protein
MKAKSEMTKELYVIIREFFITFSIQYGIFKCLNWEIPISLLFLISLIIVVTILFVNTYSIKRIIFLLAIILLAGLLMLTMFYSINALLFIKDALVWNYEYSKRIDDFHISYFIATVCILSVVIMKLVLTLEKNITAKFISAVILIVFMIICAMYNVQLNSFVIGIMLFCCLDTIVEMSQVRAGKSEKYSERCLVPFIAGAVLLSICIPSEEQPIRWIWIRETVNSITDNIKEITYAMEGTEDDKENEFNVNNVGLTENKTNFLGNISDAREKNMLSIVPGDSFRIGYLNWIVRNKYIGNGWDKDKIEQSKHSDEYMMDLYEKLYNLYRSDLKQFPNEYFAKKIKYEICFDKILTKSIFRPENCYSINTINGIGFDTFGDNVYFNKKVKEGYIYNVSALIMNMENENMKQYLRGLNENQNYYEEIKKEKVALEGSAFQEAVKEMMIYEDRVQYIMSDSFRMRLAERSSKIKEEYLQIPSETPDRVRKLARRITENCTNQYDKADAICKYLKNNYTYEIKLGELPKGKDAVDYFLFEKKSGYCTYFASSMAIMCRSVGIPVRYVEGATIDYKENENDWYYIKTGNSHAWTEIYLEGFGWIRMDSTPSSFTNNFISKEGWGISDSKPNLEVTDSNSSQSISELEAELQGESGSDEVSISHLMANNYNIVLWIKYVFVGIVLLIILGLSGIGLFIWNQKMIYKKSDNRQKVFISMKKILLNLEKQGYELKPGETLKEFIIRLDNDEGYIDDEIIKLLEWFQTVRYSKRIITEEEVFIVEQFLVSK